MQNAYFTIKREHYKTRTLFSYIKIGKEILMFGYTEIEKIYFITISFLLF